MNTGVEEKKRQKETSGKKRGAVSPHVEEYQPSARALEVVGESADISQSDLKMIDEFLNGRYSKDFVFSN